MKKENKIKFTILYLYTSSGFNPLSSLSTLLKYVTSATYKDTVYKLKPKDVLILFLFLDNA